MSTATVNRFLEAGIEGFLYAAGTGCDILGVGEMGIGNTTSATAIITINTGKPVPELMGRGKGVDDKGLKRKDERVRRSLRLHPSPPRSAPRLS